jgi:hypothetical protein
MTALELEAAAARWPDVVTCPECGDLAVVEWSDRVAGAGGAVELVKIRCVARHWFLMPADRLP